MTTLRDLGEFGMIDRIAAVTPALPDVVEGIGDDCAVVRFFDHLLLLSSDQFVEGVHFLIDGEAVVIVDRKEELQ